MQINAVEQWPRNFVQVFLYGAGWTGSFSFRMIIKSAWAFLRCLFPISGILFNVQSLTHTLRYCKPSEIISVLGDLKTIYSKLPGEYLQLVGESKGVSINGWRVHAVQDILKHPKRDGSYYLLAEKEGMTIGVKEDEFSGQVYYFDYDDDRGEKITAGLRKFFEGFRSSNK